MTARLNPCPFCGFRPEPDYTFHLATLSVLCGTCGARGPALNPATLQPVETAAQARVAWNCRSPAGRHEHD
jgi:Lar family restriction alleviation protein